MPEGSRVWTGSVEQGIWSTNSCGDWNDPNGTATFGEVQESGIGWIFFVAIACIEHARLYGFSPTLLVRGILGDYNFGGEVDAADYTVWA